MLNLKRYFIIYVFLFVICGNAYALSIDSVKVNFLSGDYKAAIREGEKLLAQNAHSDELYYFLGLSYMKDGNTLRAEDIFEIILNEFKESKFYDQARLGLGDNYFLNGDFARAKAYYEEALKINPKSKFREIFLSRLESVSLKSGAADTDYSVQVGVFSNLVNAQKLKEKLINKGYPAYTEETEVKGKVSYRLRVGKSRLRKEIVDLAEKLSRDGYPTKIYP